MLAPPVAHTYLTLGNQAEKLSKETPAPGVYKVRQRVGEELCGVTQWDGLCRL